MKPYCSELFILPRSLGAGIRNLRSASGRSSNANGSYARSGSGGDQGVRVEKGRLWHRVIEALYEIDTG